MTGILITAGIVIAVVGLILGYAIHEAFSENAIVGAIFTVGLLLLFAIIGLVISVIL